MGLKNRYFRIFWGLIGVILFWLGIFLVVNLLPSKISTEDNAEFETIFLNLKENKNYSSSFVASHNYLNRVDVLFKNPNLESRDELEIFIKDSNQDIVYQQNFTGFNFGDTSQARLDFLPIDNSKDKTYIVEIKVTKIVDGKLSFGVKNDQVNSILYYRPKFDIKNSVLTSIRLMMNIVLLWPLLLVIILLW